jgi:hypothetical protein
MIRFMAGLAMLVAAGPASDRPFDLIDGRPAPGMRLSARITATYDGRDRVVVIKGGERHVLAARVPASIVASPDESFVLLNYGSGSGQVLDMEIVQFGRRGRGNARFIKQLARKQLRDKNCHATEEEISVVFLKWLPGGRMRVQTENWTRNAHCQALDGRWDVSPKTLMR